MLYFSVVGAQKTLNFIFEPSRGREGYREPLPSLPFPLTLPPPTDAFEYGELIVAAELARLRKGRGFAKVAAKVQGECGAACLPHHVWVPGDIISTQ